MIGLIFSLALFGSFAKDKEGTPFVRHELEELGSYWSRKDLSLEKETRLLRAAKRLRLTLEKPLFRDPLKKEGWALLIDSEWTSSSGFWSDTLRAPDETPAILLSERALGAGDPSFLLVHELTHLVQGFYRPQEASWIREGTALLAEFVELKHLSATVSEAFARPETSLMAELDPRDPEYGNAKRRGAEYGHLAQYFLYIYRLCGQESLYEKLISSSSKERGREFMDEILPHSSEKPSPICRSFAASFKAFERARFEQDVSYPEGYVHPRLTAEQASVRDERSGDLPPYSAQVFRLREGERCPAGTEAWGESRCLEIRLE